MQAVTWRFSAAPRCQLITSGQCWKLLTLVDTIVNTLKNICRYVSLNIFLEKETGLLGYHGASQSAKKTRWHEIIVTLFLVFRNFFIQRGLSRYFQETRRILLAWEFRGTLGAGAIIWLDTYIERLTSSPTKIWENRDWGFDIEYCNFFHKN